MRRSPRYTGDECIPPEILDTYPNWVLALDEEGEPGQDESTIKPANIQDAIKTPGVCLPGSGS